MPPPSAGRGMTGWRVTPPFSRLALAFLDLSGRIRGRRVPLTAAAHEVGIPAIQRNFDVGGRPRWAPLSEQTVATRQRAGRWPGEGGAQPILRRTGALRRSAVAKARWRITNDGAVYGGFPNSTADRARFAHDGSRTQPARPFTTLGATDQLKVAQIFGAWSLRELRRAFPKRFLGAGRRC